jgi:hypothetical protein
MTLTALPAIAKAFWKHSITKVDSQEEESFTTREQIIYILGLFDF